jgi:anti-sigma B factor antagonist
VTQERAATFGVRRVNERASVLDIAGEVTPACEDALMDAYARACDDQMRVVILNFGGLRYMNSGGIGLLVTLLVRAGREHRRLLAYGLDEHYREIFQLTRLDEAIGVYEHEATAQAAAAERST